MNCVTMVIRIREEKQKIYIQILRGSTVCLHPWEQRYELFTISPKRVISEGIYNNSEYDHIIKIPLYPKYTIPYHTLN